MAKATVDAAPAEAAVTLSFEQLKELFAAGRETPEEKIALIRAQADENAKAQKALLKKEEDHPGISPFSYPEGDVARPRTRILTSKVIWVAEEITPDLTTAEELELLEAVRPGRYLVTRSDNSKMPVTVTAKADEVTGQIREKAIWFDTRGPLRHNLPSRVSICREILTQQSALVGA